MSNHTFELKDNDFESKIAATQGLSLVDFWAEWCGPCKVLGPTLESIAQDFEGQLKVFKVDVDANPSTPSRFNVRGIPTVILFKDGKPVDQLVGAYPKEVIAARIQQLLKD